MHSYKTMINTYVKCIRTGLVTLEDVPMLWRERVRKAMEAKNER